MRPAGIALALPLTALVLVACGAQPGTQPASPAPSTAALASSAPAGGVPVDELGNVDLEDFRQALLGEPPYPSGWEEQVNEIIAGVEAALETMHVPDVTGLDDEQAACTLWRPLVGNTDWGVGAFLERQFFIAHLTALAGFAPPEIRPAAEDALAISSGAAAEQVKPDGDSAIVSRYPNEAVRTIGLWAVEHCDLPIETDEAPDTEGWTEDEIEYSCELDRSSLERGQEEYRGGPGDGRYAEHPHVLEVTLPIFLYPAWHRLVDVDNESNPPTFEVEAIPNSFCDR